MAPELTFKKRESGQEPLSFRTESLHRAPKLEQAVRTPPNFHWAGPGGGQPPVWTDVLAEMSRHIYIRNKIGEGIQAPIFQVSRIIPQLTGGR